MSRLSIYLLSVLVFLSCSELSVAETLPQRSGEGGGRLTYCDFDLYPGTFESTSLDIVQTANPRKDGVNPSMNCAVTVSQGEKYESVYLTLPRAMDFTLNGPVITMKLLSPRAGVKVAMQIKRKASGDCPECPHLNCYRTTTKAGEWEQLSFDFTNQRPASNWYQKIVIFFDPGGESSGEAWFIDDIEGPDDDLSSISLFRRPFSRPYIAADPSVRWRGSSIAAGVVIGPSESTDGNWYYYVRGSDGTYGNSEHQTIGVLTQKADSFDPLGEWTEYRRNPVIDVGGADDWDGWRILGPAPCVMPDKSIMFFYKGRPYGDRKNNLCGLARSTDNYNFTKLSTDGPIFEGNPAGVIFHDGKYYFYQGCWLRIFEDPFKIGESERIRILNAGDGPANFDRQCVYGNRVFRLEGVDKWIMTYYGSSSHNDFPDRAHVALSDDLIHWTKVRNDRPLFTRGPHGAWDQGGIWLPMVFEFKGKLYLYYEAWGSEGFVANRDIDYFRPGCSQVGVAVCDKEDFLKWCGLL